MSVPDSAFHSIKLPPWRRHKPATTTSRSAIYYWKCDNLLPDEEKLNYHYKYEVADIVDLVHDIAVGYLDDKNLSVRPGDGKVPDPLPVHRAAAWNVLEPVLPGSNVGPRHGRPGSRTMSI